MTFEVCVDSVDGAAAAAAGGAQRVELCADLHAGGTTPSAGTIEAALDTLPGLRVHVLIRPRPGDFTYSPAEVDVMCRDVDAVRRAGAHGVVVGALTRAGDLALDVIGALVDAAGDLDLTFHRAFDLARDPRGALDEIAGLGIGRLLTSGQQASAEAGAGLIAELVGRAGDRLSVMPGGGVTPSNVGALLAATGVREVHFSARADRRSQAAYRSDWVRMGAPGYPYEYDGRATSAELVAATIAAAGVGRPAQRAGTVQE